VAGTPESGTAPTVTVPRVRADAGTAERPVSQRRRSRRGLVPWVVLLGARGFREVIGVAPPQRGCPLAL
jgi:hypothetical protein